MIPLIKKMNATVCEDHRAINLISHVADREVDPWEFSEKGQLGGSDVFIGGWGCHSPIFLKLQNVGQTSAMLQKKSSRSIL